MAKKANEEKIQSWSVNRAHNELGLISRKGFNYFYLSQKKDIKTKKIISPYNGLFTLHIALEKYAEHVGKKLKQRKQTDRWLVQKNFIRGLSKKELFIFNKKNEPTEKSLIMYDCMKIISNEPIEHAAAIPYIDEENSELVIACSKTKLEKTCFSWFDMEYSGFIRFVKDDLENIITAIYSAVEDYRFKFPRRNMKDLKFSGKY